MNRSRTIGRGSLVFWLGLLLPYRELRRLNIDPSIADQVINPYSIRQILYELPELMIKLTPEYQYKCGGNISDCNITTLLEVKQVIPVESFQNTLHKHVNKCCYCRQHICPQRQHICPQHICRQHICRQHICPQQICRQHKNNFVRKLMHIKDAEIGQIKTEQMNVHRTQFSLVKIGVAVKKQSAETIVLQILCKKCEIIIDPPMKAQSYEGNKKRTAIYYKPRQLNQEELKEINAKLSQFRKIDLGLEAKLM